MAPRGFDHLKSFIRKRSRSRNNVVQELDSEGHDAAPKPDMSSREDNSKLLAKSQSNTDVSSDLEPKMSKPLPIHSGTSKARELSDLEKEELSMPDLSKSEKLWHGAYADVRRQEPDVVRDFEAALGVDHISTRSARRLGDVLHQRLLKQDAESLVITIMGKSIKIREVGESIISFIQSTQSFLITATSNEPHAALAWATVSLLLPLILNHKTQAEAMIQGLNDITLLLRQYSIRDTLYLQGKAGSFSEYCSDYEDAVTRLYTSILLYELRFYQHLNRSSMQRGARNTAKSDDWQSWLENIKEIDAECQGFEHLFDKVVERDMWTRQDARMKNQTWIQAQILGTLKDASNTRRAEYDTGKEERLLKSLSAHYEEQKNINPRRVKETCEWLLESKKFQEWRDAKSARLLWLSAGPGCGKSVLSRCLVDEDLVGRSLSTSVICYSFFKENQESQGTAANAIGAITHQILAKYPDAGMMSRTLKRFRMHEEKLANMFSELWANLLESARDPVPGEIVCILDALDECKADERQKLLDALVDFFRHQDTSDVPLKFLITSRQNVDVENKLAEFKGSVSMIWFDGDQQSDSISQDINRFIDARINVVARKLDRFSRTRIAEHLKSMEHRTYLWLYLTFKEIEDSAIAGGTEKRFLTFISDLPKSVDQAYENILNKSKEQALTRKLLHIIVAARRALTITEINVALAVQENTRSYEPLDIEPDETFKSTLAQIVGILLPSTTKRCT